MNLRDAEPVADLDQLAPRDDDLLSSGKLVQSQRDVAAAPLFTAMSWAAEEELREVLPVCASRLPRLTRREIVF